MVLFLSSLITLVTCAIKAKKHISKKEKLDTKPMLAISHLQKKNCTYKLRTKFTKLGQNKRYIQRSQTRKGYTF